MVRLTWLSLLASRKQSNFYFVRKLWYFWIFIIYRWIFFIYNDLSFKVVPQQKIWTILSSPKCHKIGQRQLVSRYLKYQFTLKLFENNYKIYNLTHLIVIFYWLLRYHKFYMHNLIVLLNFEISILCQLYNFGIYVLTLVLLGIIIYYIAAAYLIIEYFLLFWIICICAFLQVMFFTVLERKFLALIQRRTGPRVVGVRGRLQCVADAVKLLTKVFLGPRRLNAAAFQGAAFGGFWLSWIGFGNITYGPGLDIIEIEYNIFFLLAVSLVFSIMWLLAGWSSVSKYAMLGCFRSAIQFISYEAIMGMVFLIVFVVYNAFNFELCVDSQSFFVFALFLPSLAILILFAFFMETNRPPFDLSEAESDVVAGYNVEYAGILFGLFYLGEYLNLFAACALLVVLFCGGWSFWNTYLRCFYELISWWILYIL